MGTQVVPGPSETLQSDSDTSPSRGLVLVVDDEEQNRTLMKDPLEAHGYRVVEVENGISALQKVEEEVPDVILLDLMMPKMDGFEVCRRLKKYWKSAHVPILVMTALSDRKERLMGIEAGANDFLTKPVDVQDIILRVNNAVYTKRLHDLLQVEREKSERLLRNMLPKAIAERMKKGELNIAEQHADATLLIADLVGFTTLTSSVDPVQVVSLLNEIFSAFDVLTEKRGLEKIKIIGDAYMAAGGIHSHQSDHAEAIAELAIAFQDQVARFNEQYSTGFRIRIGIHTGPLVAGVIGRKTFAYDVWGDTVNTACRLESTGKGGAIQISESTHQHLKDKYTFGPSHVVELKDHGTMPAYWLPSIFFSE
ncbi:MAG TPA: adenylate/guanylate cyclase domain-containing protein [Verrucomicrobiae bacterium]|jgi:class 3 adenylate cyclase|nr:adenylate/guanylate cyclase domain-containing protein [Verrucomicrobiae bacterium]